MPVYDMKCPQGHMWEEQRPMSECDVSTVCPVCGQLGHITFTTAPCFPWYPGSTREVYKEKRRNH